MKKYFSLLIALCLILSLAACGGSGEPVSEPDTAETEEPAPAPEPEPEPEPYIPPEPVTYSGSGDDVVIIDPIDFAYAIYIEGNSDAQHFAVTCYDGNNQQIDLLVNTTEPYSGTVLDPTLTTALLEIKATGAWSVTFVPLESYPVATSGQTVQGQSDEVFLCDGTPKTAKISGNSDAQHFAIWAYGSNATDLLVNTTDPYDGTVMLPSNTSIFQVNSESDWSITLN